VRIPVHGLDLPTTFRGLGSAAFLAGLFLRLCGFRPDLATFTLRPHSRGSKSYYQSGPCPASSIPWALPGLSASPRTSAWRRIRYEEVQGRCQAMLLCLRGVIGLGHGVDRLLPSSILDYCSQIIIEAVDADGAQRLQAVRERRALSGNCNTRQHQLFANGSTRRRQAVQRASRRSPHLSCTPGTRHGIDAAMQSCNHPHA